MSGIGFTPRRRSPEPICGVDNWAERLHLLEESANLLAEVKADRNETVN